MFFKPQEVEYIKKGYTLINNQKVRIGSNIDLEESSFIYDFIKTDRSIKTDVSRY